jgi:acetoin utilization deacetylase AcuC-like enzyme
MQYFHHPSSSEHDPRAWLPEHPDTPVRIEVIEAALDEEGWSGCERRLAPQASEDQLAMVHTRVLIDRIGSLAAAGGGEIDGDTYVGEASYRAALHAAGGACAMVESILSGCDRIGFSGMRPAGHHAEAGRAMGFCLFNNIAVAAEFAIGVLGVRRVMIIDWDVHHGNGTAEIFRRRNDVLFTSIHQLGLYPGTGSASDVGSGDGLVREDGLSRP